MDVPAAEVGSLWQAALEDAGITSDDAILFAFPGRSAPDGDHGKSWPRKIRITGEGDVVSLGARLKEANSDAIRPLRRVAVWTDRTPEGLAGVLRHELEHSRQLDMEPRLRHLYGDATWLLIEVAGGVPGSNALYNQIPMEVDANRAASRFVRECFGSERIDELIAKNDPDIAVFRPGPAPDLRSLPARMERFLNGDGRQLAQEFVDQSRS